MNLDFRNGSTITPMIAGTSPYGGHWQVWNYFKGLRTSDNTTLRVGREIEDYTARASLKAVDPKWLVKLGLPATAVTSFKYKTMDSVSWEEEGIPYRTTPDGKLTLTSKHRKPLFLIEAKRCQYSDKALWKNPLPMGRGPDEEEITFGAHQLESEIPSYYFDQCQHHLIPHPEVMVVLLPVIFNWTDTPQIYVVFRNNERIAELKRMNKEFWNNHILIDVPPVPDASNAMKEYLKRQEAAEEKYLEAEDNHYLMMHNLLEAKEHLSKVKGIIQENENKLKDAIGDHWGLQFKENGRLTFKPNSKGTRTFSHRSVKKEQLYAFGGELS